MTPAPAPADVRSGVRSVRLTLLGPVTAVLDGVPSPLRNRSDLLLARLVTEPRPHGREELAEWLWPESPREARLHSLREALRRLRAAIGEPHSHRPALEIDRTWVRFEPPPEEVTCDWLEVREALAAVQRHEHRRLEACPACLDRLRAVVAAVEWEFAAGDWDALGPGVAEWVEGNRARLRTEAAWAWGVLADAAAERGETSEALAASEAQLARDPWEEAAHRRVMRALAASGRTAQAVARYEALAARLDAELGVTPDDATEELYQRILHGESAEEEVARPVVEPPRVTTTANAFVGRESELQWFEGALTRTDARWFTITGVGGIGKSRLAREVGRRAGPSFRGGAAFVPLAPVTDAQRLPAEVALALGLSLVGVADPARHVADFLRTREVLLVLDNLEHLPEAALEAARWLEWSPGLRVLATSRERLGLSCEHVWPLEGLSITGDDPDAVRLWTARIRQLDPTRLFDADELAGAARIARSVGGHPLAIELAAEAGATAEVGDIADRLERDLSFLATSRRDALAHQRTLHEVLASTWRRLDPGLRAAAEALSVFAGPFDAEAAAGVADTGPAVLRALADRCLLSSAGGRWSMHPLLRRFAGAIGDGAARSDRHAAWFLGRVRAAQSVLRRGEADGRDAFAPWWEDLAAAFRHCRAAGRAHDAVELADAIHLLSLAMGWEAHGLAILEELGAVPPDHPRSGKLVFARAQLAWRCRGAASAIAHLDQGLEWAAANHQPVTWVEVATLRGAVARNVGSHAEAVRWLERAEQQARELPASHPVAALAVYQLAMSRYDAERLPEALALLDAAVGRLAAAGSERVAVHARSIRGLCRVRLGDPAGLDEAREAMRTFVERQWHGAGDPAQALALALVELGRAAEAARAARTAEAQYARISFRPGVQSARFLQLVAAVARRSRRDALSLGTSLVDHALALGGSRATFEALAAVALLHATGDRPERAAPLLARLRADEPPAAPDARRLLDRFAPPTDARPADGDLPTLLLREHAALWA